MGPVLKRGTFKRPPPRPAKAWTADELPGARVPVVVPVVDAPISPQPKDVKAKPGKRAPKAEEARWMDEIVAYGCVACRMDNPLRVTPPAVHHILRGGRRIGHRFTLPLCDPGHHQGGQPMGMTSRHPWKARFERIYGSEDHLLRTLCSALGWGYPG